MQKSHAPAKRLRLLGQREHLGETPSLDSVLNRAARGLSARLDRGGGQLNRSEAPHPARSYGGAVKPGKIVFVQKRICGQLGMLKVNRDRGTDDGTAASAADVRNRQPLVTAQSAVTRKFTCRSAGQFVRRLIDGTSNPLRVSQSGDKSQTRLIKIRPSLRLGKARETVNLPAESSILTNRQVPLPQSTAGGANIRGQNRNRLRGSRRADEIRTVKQGARQSRISRNRGQPAAQVRGLARLERTQSGQHRLGLVESWLRRWSRQSETLTSRRTPAGQVEGSLREIGRGDLGWSVRGPCCEISLGHTADNGSRALAGRTSSTLHHGVLGRADRHQA